MTSSWSLNLQLLLTCVWNSEPDIEMYVRNLSVQTVWMHLFLLRQSLYICKSGPWAFFVGLSLTKLNIFTYSLERIPLTALRMCLCVPRSMSAECSQCKLHYWTMILFPYFVICKWTFLTRNIIRGPSSVVFLFYFELAHLDRRHTLLSDLGNCKLWATCLTTEQAVL